MTHDPLLRVENLEAWYGESKILHGVSIDVPRGETVALLGRNGAGKSTTLKAVMGIIRQRSGSIVLGGAPIESIPLHHVMRRGLGYVPEERGIFASLTVAENLVLPPRIAKSDVTLQDIYKLFPNLAERGSSLGTTLSGGEQQMLAIARMLLTGVNCLLLDEPTEGLAPVIVRRIGEVLRFLKTKGMTVLLVEQNFSFAQKVADRFFVMEHGKIIDKFSAADLSDRIPKLSNVLGL